jgi:endonuclease/exonuclease/phosphatase family metal-dependent hydrolase
MEKEMKIINLKHGFFVHNRIVSSVKISEFVSDRVSYIILRGRWNNIIVLNVHEPSEEKSDESIDIFYQELEQVFDHFPKYNTKILLGDFNAKMERENIFKATIGKEILHQDSNDNGVRLVDFATSKNLVVKSTMFPHRSIHKYTWTPPEGKTHNQIDHILIDRRWHSRIIDARSFRGADCDTDHYLVAAKVRERLAVNKQAAQNFGGERDSI